MTHEGEAAVVSDQHFSLRVLAFLALVIGVNLWLDHHQGLRVANASVTSMVSAAVAGGLGLLAKLLTETEQKSLLASGLRLVRVVFWPPLLVAAWVAALVLALTLSSVTVVAEAEGNRFKAALTSGAEPRAVPDDAFRESANGVVRILVHTNPFGRVMRLAVPGYVPAILDVFPLVGRRVVLGIDVRPAPSVLLRLPFGAHGLLAEDTHLVVQRLTGDRVAPVAEVATRKNVSAFLLGRRREVPTALRRDWEIELEADGVTRVNKDTAPLLAMMLNEWRHPSPLPTPVSLEPGMTLVAELRAPGGRLAVATVTLSAEPFQDVALRSPEE